MMGSQRETIRVHTGQILSGARPLSKENRNNGLLNGRPARRGGGKVWWHRRRGIQDNGMVCFNTPRAQKRR
jgi:hypothetical protein